MAPRDDQPAETNSSAQSAPLKPAASVSEAKSNASAVTKPRAQDVATDEALPDATPHKRHLARRAMIAAIASIGPIAAILLGLYLYLAGGRIVATDNAYIKSAKIAVSPDVSGPVVDVSISENEIVTPGMLLFRVDPAPFRIALDEAEARLLAARQDVEALRAAYRGNAAALERAKGDVAFHEEQVARQKGLSDKRLVSDTIFDAAKRALRNAQDDVKVAEQARAEALAKLAGNPAIAVDDHPAVRAAVAVRNRAALELARTKVTATVAGIVTNFDLQPGEYVEAGNAVFSLVGTDDIWVHANYKETELTHVRIGQPANDHGRYLSRPHLRGPRCRHFPSDRRRVRPAAAAERDRQLGQGRPAPNRAHPPRRASQQAIGKTMQRGFAQRPPRQTMRRHHI